MIFVVINKPGKLSSNSGRGCFNFTLSKCTRDSKWNIILELVKSFAIFWYMLVNVWRSRDELIRDVLLWIPTHGRAKAGRPARTYIQQLCEDTGCCPEDLPRAMNDREEWRERVRDIRAASTI